MKSLSRISLFLAILSPAWLAAYAQSNQPQQNQQVDLSGEWVVMSAGGDREQRVLITQAGKAIFIRKGKSGSYQLDCVNGGKRDHLFDGQLQGTNLTGRIIVCTKWKPLIDDCHLDSVFETSFKTTVARNEIISGTVFAEGWKYDEKNGHLVNCHRDDRFNETNEFQLDRSCYFSGLDWVKRYPDSKSTADLAEPFRTSANKFIGALQAAGAKVSDLTTNRPVERSYLMHYAWQIAHGMDARKVDDYVLGIGICWVHRDANGDFDLAASRTAAQQMIGPEPGYNMAHDAAWDDQWLNLHVTKYSQHNLNTGIDMTITWTGTLTITDGNGQQVTIASTPRNGNNTDLQAVGATYGVLKLATDAPHWSATGH